jgi:predicted dehydrogenase
MIATAWTWRLQVFGTKGWAHMRDSNTLDVRMVDAEVTTRVYPETNAERLELEDFARAVAGEKAYAVPVDEATHGIAVLEAIGASAAADGARVQVP